MYNSLFILLKAVKKIIRQRRFETSSLQEVLQGLKVSDCEWLMPKPFQGKSNVSNMQMQQSLLAEFVYWFFNSFLFNLLKVCVSCKIANV